MSVATVQVMSISAAEFQLCAFISEADAGKMPRLNIFSLGPLRRRISALRKRRSSEFRVRDSSSSSGSLHVSSPCPRPADPAGKTPASCACCATPVAPAPSVSRSGRKKKRRRKKPECECSSHMFSKGRTQQEGNSSKHKERHWLHIHL